MKIAMALILASCGSTHLGTSELNDISDVQSMWQRSDGNFDVLCRDNTRETVSATMIQKQLVCNGSAQLSESFRVGKANAVDLIVVIDNSSSMEEYQAKMISSLGPILSSIVELDWQIGIVTTDSACLRSGRTITRADYVSNFSEAEYRFQSGVTPGGGGAVIERGILYATEAVKGHCGSPSHRWVRPNAQVAALVISDEPNCGGAINEGCPGQPGETAEYFVDNTPAGTKFFGLLFDQTNPLCPYRDTPPPLQYWRLAQATGGLWGDICASSYDSFLTRMSSELAAGISSQIQLSQDPNPEQLIVFIDGVELGAQDYALNGRTIQILATVQNPDAQVIVMYKRLN